jgi:uncharacterized lipoprotein YmbA
MKQQKTALRTRWLRTPLLLTCLLIAGCATSPKANFYTLAAESAAEELCGTNVQGLLIKIELLHFPDLLAQPQIATRPQPNRIEYAEFHRWAGSLENDFKQSLGANLQQHCRSIQVIPDFWPGDFAPYYLLYVDVVRFDGNLGGSANLSATWGLKNQQQHDVLAERHSAIFEPVSDNSFSGLVTAQSRTVASLAREIIQTLLRSK